MLRIGPGLDRINPLDAGPWRQGLDRVDERTGALVRSAVTDRRLNMLVALATLVRRGPVSGSRPEKSFRWISPYACNRSMLSQVVRVRRSRVSRSWPAMKKLVRSTKGACAWAQHSAR
ncbi:hypothetical protein ACFWDN_05030 [Micromonospora chalcea]